MSPFDAADIADDDLLAAGYGVPTDDITVEEDLVLPGPNDPMAVANSILDLRYRSAGHLVLRHWRGTFIRWDGTHWAEFEEAGLRSEVYKTLEGAVRLHGKDDDEVPWEPSRRKVTDVVDAVKAITFMRETIEAPSWLASAGGPPATELVAVRNGLLHIPSRRLLSHDPRFFNRAAVPFDFDPEAPAPAGWLRFLGEIWPDEPDAVSALQEFTGYVLGGSTNLHKALLMVGPTRGGKGVIARVVTALVGRQHVAAPTLASLATNFGLAPLIGKPLAVISDARLGGAGTHVVVERLLSVTGEDSQGIDRKFREPWTGKLGTRFFIISNELPRFGDSSRAIARRFLVLTTRHSWLGRENPRLTDQLLDELPGILNWALDGLDRLGRNGRFTQPAGAEAAIRALEDLASPMSAFVRERCYVHPTLEVPVDSLFDNWRRWCEEQGIEKPGTVQTFGRDLRAVVPSLGDGRQQEKGSRFRLYVGIGLTPPVTPQ